ncbi:Uncharacterized protein RNJ44_04217 [Nakaseomyces bracarensis]|uniref:Uncharacterized protein n=1 Tax=Nakaseomyces bracarensis TaxID=273131 RepID=A0ABR4NUA5_9SACH
MSGTDPIHDKGVKDEEKLKGDPSVNIDEMISATEDLLQGSKDKKKKNNKKKKKKAKKSVTESIESSSDSKNSPGTTDAEDTKDEESSSTPKKLNKKSSKIQSRPASIVRVDRDSIKRKSSDLDSILVGIEEYLQTDEDVKVTIADESDQITNKIPHQNVSPVKEKTSNKLEPKEDDTKTGTDDKTIVVPDKLEKNGTSLKNSVTKQESQSERSSAIKSKELKETVIDTSTSVSSNSIETDNGTTGINAEAKTTNAVELNPKDTNQANKVTIAAGKSKTSTPLEKKVNVEEGSNPTPDKTEVFHVEVKTDIKEPNPDKDLSTTSSEGKKPTKELATEKPSEYRQDTTRESKEDSNAIVVNENIKEVEPEQKEKQVHVKTGDVQETNSKSEISHTSVKVELKDALNKDSLLAKAEPVAIENDNQQSPNNKNGSTLDMESSESLDMKENKSELNTMVDVSDTEKSEVEVLDSNKLLENPQSKKANISLNDDSNNLSFEENTTVISDAPKQPVVEKNVKQKKDITDTKDSTESITDKQVVKETLAPTSPSEDNISEQEAEETRDSASAEILHNSNETDNNTDEVIIDKDKNHTSEKNVTIEKVAEQAVENEKTEQNTDVIKSPETPKKTIKGHDDETPIKRVVIGTVGSPPNNKNDENLSETAEKSIEEDKTDEITSPKPETEDAIKSTETTSPAKVKKVPAATATPEQHTEKSKEQTANVNAEKEDINEENVLVDDGGKKGDTNDDNNKEKAAETTSDSKKRNDQHISKDNELTDNQSKSTKTVTAEEEEDAGEIMGLDLGPSEEVKSLNTNEPVSTEKQEASSSIQDILDETDKLLEELNFVDDSEINAMLSSLDNKSSQSNKKTVKNDANTIKTSDIAKANEDLPVYIFTSLAGGGFHMIPRTNRLATILTANRVKFEYRDLGTDDEARKVWKTYGRGRTLPGLVRGRDDIIGNWEEVEEVNENYGLRDLIYNTI